MFFTKEKDNDDYTSRELARESEDMQNEIEKEKRKTSFAEYVENNKIFFITCAVAIISLIVFVIGLLKEAPNWFIEAVATVLIICIILENLFNPLHRNR